MRKVLILFSIIAVLAFAGCDMFTGTGLLTMKLTDAPLELDGKTVATIEVTITKVEVSKATEEGAEDGEWITVIDEEQDYDLMKLRDGSWDFLAEEVSLDAGQYNQIRIYVNEDNIITFENESTEYDLKIPSGTQSGVKLVGTFDVTAGEETEVVVDFDAQKSVTVSSDGNYILKPTIKMVTDPDLEDEPTES